MCVNGIGGLRRTILTVGRNLARSVKELAFLIMFLAFVGFSIHWFLLLLPSR